MMWTYSDISRYHNLAPVNSTYDDENSVNHTKQFIGDMVWFRI